MANLCSNYLEITGNEKDISIITKKIEKQNKNLIDIFPWFEFSKYNYGLWKDCFTPAKKSICLSFGSKWNFPFDELQNLVKHYPTLTFEAIYEEPSMEIFGKVHAKNNDYIETRMKPLEYFSEYNEDFATKRECIEELPYDEFLKYTLEFDYEKDFTYPYLIPLIIERIKKEDLSLFVNKFSQEELFLKKLKEN